MVPAVIALATTALGGLSGTVHMANGRPAPNAVVWMENGEKGRPVENAVIDQRDRKFTPHILAVSVGSKVAFPNHDTIYHNVFANYDRADTFDLKFYPRGSTKYTTFPAAGTVYVGCSIHPDMSAFIVVVDSPYFVVADDRGRFDLTHVPPGNYTLHVWHESQQQFSTKIQLGPGSNTEDIVLSRR